MKKNILTTILLVLLVALCAYNIFLSVKISDAKKDQENVTAELNKSKADNNTLFNELSELKTDNNDLTNELADLKELIKSLEDLFDSRTKTYRDYVDMTGVAAEQLYREETDSEVVCVYEWKMDGKYKIVYFKDMGNELVEKDSVFYKYNWRKYVLNTELIPLLKNDEFKISKIKQFFGEPDEEPSIFFSGMKAIQWSLGEGYSLLVLDYFPDQAIKNFYLVYPDGTYELTSEPPFN